MNKAKAVMVYRSGVNLTMSRKGYLTECWVSTQPITGTNNNCHAEKSLFSISTSINNTKGRDSDQKHLRMTSYNRGFTLIEFLVVVLIIGILAAIAVPQYQKVTEQITASEAKLWLEKLAEAQKIYYAEHGQYTYQLRDLDIQIPEESIYSSTSFHGNHFNFSITWAGGNIFRAMAHRSKNHKDLTGTNGYTLWIYMDQQGNKSRKCQKYGGNRITNDTAPKCSYLNWK